MTDLYAGWHLTYDAVVKEDHAANLVDLDFLRKTLLDAAPLVGMRLFSGPDLRDVSSHQGDGDDLKGGEVLGTVVGVASHFILHTWPLRHRLCFDAFSCSKFEGDVLGEFLWDRFSVKRRSSHWIVRAWP